MRFSHIDSYFLVLCFSFWFSCFFFREKYRLSPQKKFKISNSTIFNFLKGLAYFWLRKALSKNMKGGSLECYNLISDLFTKHDPPLTKNCFFKGGGHRQLHFPFSHKPSVKTLTVTPPLKIFDRFKGVRGVTEKGGVMLNEQL